MRSKRGFTLVELLVVVGIISILATVVIFNLVTMQTDAKLKATYGTINSIALAMEQYRADMGSYPPRQGWVEALDKGLGASIRWHGPYFDFDGSKLGRVNASGQLENPKASPLAFYDAGEAGPILFDQSQQVYLDTFGRPFVYVPHTQYPESGWAVRSENETPYIYANPTTFQMLSFGFDGMSRLAGDGSIDPLLYNDDIDNDGDGLVDRGDNVRSSENALIEDDLFNL